MKPYTVLPEMLWRVDPEIDALSKRPGWSQFHREAGKRSLAFDRMAKVGRVYQCVAFSPQKNGMGGWVAVELARGEGKTALASVDDAYRKSGRCDEVLDRLWNTVLGLPVAAAEEVKDDFEALFDEDFESLFD